MDVSITTEKPKKGKQINVNETVDQIRDIVDKTKEAIGQLKGSNVSIENWHFSVDQKAKEYAVDFAIRLIVKPQE
jgi:copper homeostasis protein CutC